MLSLRTALRRATGCALGATMVGAMALVGGPPAAAAPAGTVDCSGSGSHPCYRDGGSFRLHNKPVVTGLVAVTVDGRTLTSYRTEMTPVDAPADYRQGGWNSTKSWPSATVHARRATLNWILHNSYPAVPTDQLASRLGEDPRTLHVNASQAVAATQAAIWHVTGALAGTDLPQFTAGERLLYRDLTMRAGTLDSKPAPRLSIDPSSVSGTAGGQAGPLTVHSNAPSVTLSTTGGVSLVDGTDSGAVHDGQRVSLRLPAGAAGSGAVHAAATATVHRGRIMAAADGDQWLLSTGANKATTRLDVPVDWTGATTGPTAGPSATASPTGTPSHGATPTAPVSPTRSAGAGSGGDLPVTGTAVSLIAGAGTVLLAAGAALLLLLRRRRRIT